MASSCPSSGYCAFDTIAVRRSAIDCPDTAIRRHLRAQWPAMEISAHIMTADVWGRSQVSSPIKYAPSARANPSESPIEVTKQIERQPMLYLD